jgi:hypothetical protein
MTENEGRTECARLARQDPARNRFAWFARQAALGDWSIPCEPIGGLRVEREGLVESHDPAPARPNPNLDPPLGLKPWWGLGSFRLMAAFREELISARNARRSGPLGDIARAYLKREAASSRLPLQRLHSLQTPCPSG